MLQKSFLRLVLKTAHEMGWSIVSVHDGEEASDATGKSISEVIKMATATDEAYTTTTPADHATNRPVLRHH